MGEVVEFPRPKPNLIAEGEYSRYLGHIKAGIPEEQARALAALGYRPHANPTAAEVFGKHTPLPHEHD